KRSTMILLMIASHNHLARIFVGRHLFGLQFDPSPRRLRLCRAVALWPVSRSIVAESMIKAED
ncbi:MAG: hypothetical protein SF339_22465, partial [Blastocatellia bacterium]|nr:hypothetical protein [Blastocatellia bacterium]